VYENKWSIFHRSLSDLIHKNILILLFVHHYPAVVDLVFIHEYLIFFLLTYFFLCVGRVKRKNLKKGEKSAKDDEDADED
jgi:hypothetical protein